MISEVQAFKDRAKSLAARVRKARSVAIFSHIDADGVSSAAIAYRAVERAGAVPKVHFLRSLGEKEIRLINSSGDDLVWICDLGAGSYKSIDRSRCIITDHHHIFGSGQSFLEFFGGMDNMLNPVEFGFEGSEHLSGAGCTYFVARELDPANVDLAYLAIVGAVGDLQDKKARKLSGPLHESVIEDAKRTGVLQVVENDLPFFGWATRTAAAMIAFSNDLKAIGCECTFNDVNQLFKSHGISTYRGRRNPSIKDENLSKYYSWSELESENRNIIKIALRNLLNDKDIEPTVLDGMLGDVYLFPSYPLGSASREAKEFATMLNASGRYLHCKAEAAHKQIPDRPRPGGDEMNEEFQGELIIKACLDPVSFSSDAMTRIGNHRDNLRKGQEEIHSIIPMEHLQYIRGWSLVYDKKKQAYVKKGSKSTMNVEDTILGIVVGMALDQKPTNTNSNLVVDRNKPLLAMATVMTDEFLPPTEDEGSAGIGRKDKNSLPPIKISVRMHRDLVDSGIHLGEAMKHAAAEVKGYGGGHNVAAGATIPNQNVVMKFLKALDQEIGEQKARFSP